MHSYTFNSELSSPTRHWLKTWMLAAALAVASVAGWEIYCRIEGFPANSVIDNSELWGDMRERASQYGDKAIVLVGASRIQLGLVPGILQRYLHAIPVQLGIDGNSFFPVLRDLADDDTVTGIVVVSVTAYGLADNVKHNRANLWVADYNRRKSSPSPYFYLPFEKRLVNLLNSAFAYRIAGAKPSHLLMKLLSGQSGFSGHIETLPDRSRRAYYTKTDDDSSQHPTLPAYQPTPPSTIRTFNARLDELSRLVDKIQARGGKVFLVRFPSSGRVWEAEEQQFPKSIFWSKIASSVSAETIHFKDYPSLQHFALYDDSHLDYRNAQQFTSALSDIILERLPEKRRGAPL